MTFNDQVRELAGEITRRQERVIQEQDKILTLAKEILNAIKEADKEVEDMLKERAAAEPFKEDK